MKRTPIYVPATSCSLASYFSYENERLYASKNITKNIRFFNKDYDPFKETYIYHPYILFTAAYYYKDKDVRKKFKIDKDALVFLDSGGYQLSTGKAGDKFTIKKAFDWCEENGDIFPILDLPCPKNPSTEAFNLSLDTSCKNAKYYADNRTNDKAHILNVISGTSQSQLEEWYKKISVYEFDGWAHGKHWGSLKSILRGIILLINNGEYDKGGRVKHHHIFGLTNNKAILYMAMIQHILNKLDLNVQITYDSSSFQKAAAFGHVYAGAKWTGMESFRLSNRFDYTNMGANVPCQSPIFEEPLADVDDFINTPLVCQSLLSLNNLYWTLHWKNFADQLVQFGVNEVLYSLIGDADAAKTDSKKKGRKTMNKMRQNLDAIETILSDPKKGYWKIDNLIDDDRQEMDTIQTLESFF